jgi:hypothetical protein
MDRETVQAIIKTDSPVYTVEYLEENGVDARHYTDSAIIIELVPSRGDEVRELSEGKLRIVQDAIVATVMCDLIGITLTIRDCQ